MRSLNLVIAPLVLALAACGSQAPERSEDVREAEGEVLGGTISDEMLPLDQLRSQSPILREAPAAAEAGDEDGEDADEDGGGEAGEGAQPAEPAEPAAPQE